MPRPGHTPPQTAREAALRALHDIDVKEAYANLALDAHLKGSKLPGRERGLATELVYGTVRRLGTIDWAILQVVDRPIAKIDPWIRNILREAVYQILYMDRIPHRAAVDEAVELAKKYGHVGVAKFANGVLRGFLRKLPDLPWPDAAREGEAGLAVLHSHPEWLIRQWQEQFGQEETIRLLESNNRIPPLTIRANRTKATREQVAEALAAEGVETEPTRYSPDGLIVHDLTSSSHLDGLKAMKAGLFSVQDESSMLVGPVLAPQEGWTVVDVAAAPGGKTTHIAELMGNEGRVIAVDIHPHKVELIEQNARRLGLSSVQGLCADARELGKLMPNRADAILCDLPCSGLGTLARRPDARWRKTEEDTPALVEIQDAILESAAQVLKSGGVLVYSTCTIDPRENQQRVEAFVERHPEFALDDIRPFLPEALRADARGGYVQLLPHIHGTDGFFIARLKKG